MKTVIYHIDVNSAFFSGKPHTVFIIWAAPWICAPFLPRSPGIWRQGTALFLPKALLQNTSASIPGRRSWEARQKCPALYMVPPNYGLYQKCSDAFIKVLNEYTPTVEQYSIDEAFMDMSSTLHLFGSPAGTAMRIRDRIREELGFTVNIGISSNKLLAKMASGFRKPDRVHTLFPEEIQENVASARLGFIFCGQGHGLQAPGSLVSGRLASLRQAIPSFSPLI